MKDKTITLKELFERLVVLETKVDSQRIVSHKTSHTFYLFAVVLVVLAIFNIVLHGLLILK